jgi:hypothetical protein
MDHPCAVCQCMALSSRVASRTDQASTMLALVIHYGPKAVLECLCKYHKHIADVMTTAIAREP